MNVGAIVRDLQALGIVEGDVILFDDRTVGPVRFPFESVLRANLRVDLEDEFKRRR